MLCALLYTGLIQFYLYLQKSGNNLLQYFLLDGNRLGTARRKYFML